MNHKWNKDNTCVNCGIVREMKDCKTWQRVETVLINGVWEDKDFYTYGRKWYYGIPHPTIKYLISGIGFKRPDCKPNQQQ